jgi:tRNA A37 N6-isopentenylltransferase MiaA
MFRVGVLYFTKCGGAVGHEEKSKRVTHTVYEELLRALEKARTRLAVAIATETKATPLTRWNSYLETADKMHRCLRELRSASRPGTRRQEDWARALDILKQIPRTSDVKSRGEANLLCQHLHAVLTQLGQLRE